MQEILIKILGVALTETELDSSVKEQLTPEVISALYAVSKHHDLAHIVAAVLYSNNVEIEKEVASKFSKEEILSVYRYEQMKYAYEEICEAFEEEQIPYIPLKGSIIRPYYPQESMRTSCDIDILVHEEDIERAACALEKKEYTRGEREYHDISLFSPTDIHLELHFNIQENIDNLDSMLKEAWQYATPKEGMRYEFTREFFLFHIYAHMSYHFLSGGCGIRPLMDIWIIEHKMGVGYAQAQELLERAGIYKFAQEISKLVDCCFSEKEWDEFSQKLLSYILSGGVCGTTENKIAVKKTKNKSTIVYVWRRLFLPYKSMTILYPILKKVPILLPFCWVIRFFKMLFGGESRKALTEVKTANALTETQVKEIQEIRSRLGL